MKKILLFVLCFMCMVNVVNATSHTCSVCDSMVDLDGEGGKDPVSSICFGFTFESGKPLKVSYDYKVSHVDLDVKIHGLTNESVIAILDDGRGQVVVPKFTRKIVNVGSTSDPIYEVTYTVDKNGNISLNDFYCTLGQVMGDGKTPAGYFIEKEKLSAAKKKYECIYNYDGDEVKLRADGSIAINGNQTYKNINSLATSKDFSKEYFYITPGTKEHCFSSSELSFSSDDIINGICPEVVFKDSGKRGTYNCSDFILLKTKEDAKKEENYVPNSSGNQKDQNDSYQKESDTDKYDVKTFDFCNQEGVLKSFKIVGILLDIIRILVPLLLIIMGSFDFYKAIIAGDDKTIKSSVTALTMKAIAGVIIFFIPTIVYFAMDLVSNWSDVVKGFENCKTCMDNTSKCDDLISEAEK